MFSAWQSFRRSPTSKYVSSWSSFLSIQLDSTNIHPDHWKQIAQAIWNHYEEYDGFVVTHGTDT
ncbi:asparaginase, partial [Gemmiger formicilis]|uniref:asparaginase domain-containing protein n=1 Tax=Gemmiger formicilis TaxID=745368 RepID=UPI001956E8BC|nr:asparaginase [Gemmiger formicilis]